MKNAKQSLEDEQNPKDTSIKMECIEKSFECTVSQTQGAHIGRKAKHLKLVRELARKIQIPMLRSRGMKHKFS